MGRAGVRGRMSSDIVLFVSSKFLNVRSAECDAMMHQRMPAPQVFQFVGVTRTAMLEKRFLAKDCQDDLIGQESLRLEA